MAAFDYFNQIQVPSIPISLFGDAAAQGTEIGSKLGTPFSNAAQGFLSGLGKGQQLYQGMQQTQLNQQNIEANRAKLPAVQAEAQLRETSARQGNAILTQNEPEILAAGGAQVAAGLTTARTNAEVANQTNAVITGMGSWDTQTMVQGLQTYGAAFASNPNLMQYYGNALLQRPDFDSVAGPYARSTLEAQLRKSKATSDYEQNALARETAYRTASEKYSNHEGFDAIGNATGIVDPSTQHKSTVVLQEGSFKVDPATNQIALTNTGRPIPNPTPTSTGKVSVYRRDPSTGAISDPNPIVTGLPYSFKQSWDSFGKAERLRSGAGLRQQYEEIDADIKTKQGQSVSDMQPEKVIPPSPTQQQGAAFTPASIAPQYQSVIKQYLPDLTSTAYRFAETEIGVLVEMSKDQAAIPYRKSDASFREKKQRQVDSIARYIVNEELKIPGKNRYTQLDVDRYQAYNIFGQLKEEVAEGGGIPLTPDELYFVKRRQEIELQVDNMFDGFLKISMIDKNAPAVSREQDDLTRGAYSLGASGSLPSLNQYQR